MVKLGPVYISLWNLFFYHLGAYEGEKSLSLRIFSMFHFSSVFFIFRLLFFIWNRKAVRKCGINYRGNHLLFYHFLLVPAKIKMGISVFRDLNVRHDWNSIIWKKGSQKNLSTCIEKAADFNEYPSGSPISLLNAFLPFQKCSLDQTTDEMV